MKNYNLISTIFFTIFSYVLFAQNPSIEWQKCIGGSNNEDGYSIIQTTDGGYIAVGKGASTDFDLIENQDGSVLFIVKLSDGGAIEWTKCLEGTGAVLSPKITQNNRGGYTISAIVASNNRYDMELPAPKDMLDFNGFVMELDTVGNVIWQKIYGGSGFDKLNSMIQTPDGGYLFVGNSSSNDGDLQNLNFFPFNIGWIVKIDSVGEIEWQKLIGGSGYDELSSVSLCSDDGYIVAGSSTSTDGDIQGNIWGECVWIIKLNSYGIIQWQKSIGRDIFNQAKDVKQCSDGGYIVACDKNHTFADDRDGFIVKLSSIGTVEWQTDVGGDRDDFFTSILETTDGGFIVGGTVRSYSGNIPLPIYGVEDCWIVKLSSNGNIEWQRRFGGNNSDYLNSIVQTIDNGFIFVGSTKSISDDVIGNHATGSYPFYSDMWVVKLSSTVSIEDFEKNKSFRIHPNPTNSILNLNVSSDFLNKTYQILNILGQIIVSDIIVSEITPLNVSQLPKGIYLVQIGNSKTDTQKFIKN